MSNINFTYTNLTPFKWYVLENFPFIEADFDAVTNWQLFCKLGKEMNKIINSVNASGQQVENLTTAFNNLQNYVNNYFDNLDIQEEVNNKLDQMAQSGELTELLTAYLNLKCILAFDTVEDMSNATNLIDGSYCKTYGKDMFNDGYGRFYKIRTITTSDVIDGINIIKINNSDTLIAELIKEQTIDNIIESINNVKSMIPINYHNYPTIGDGVTKSRYYIDGINGDDNNIGSKESPIKTIDKFFELLNQGKTDIRCYIVSPGIYKASKTIFSNSTIHITAKVAGVVIEFQNDEELSTTGYNTHWNISGVNENTPITLRNLSINTSIYFDNSALRLDYVTFENCSYLGFNGSHVRGQYVGFPAVRFGESCGDIYGLNIKQNDNIPIQVVRGSNVVLRGAWNFDTKTIEQPIVVQERSILTFHPTFNISTPITNQPALKCIYGIIRSTSKYIDGLAKLSSVDNEYSQVAILRGLIDINPGTYSPN